MPSNPFEGIDTSKIQGQPLTAYVYFLRIKEKAASQRREAIDTFTKDEIHIKYRCMKEKVSDNETEIALIEEEIRKIDVRTLNDVIEEEEGITMSDDDDDNDSFNNVII